MHSFPRHCAFFLNETHDPIEASLTSMLCMKFKQGLRRHLSVCLSKKMGGRPEEVHWERLMHKCLVLSGIKELYLVVELL